MKVDYATANGTASAPSDYASRGGTLTFSSGQTQKTIEVPVKGDTLDEPDETFSVALSNPSNATISDGRAVGTITDDDPPLPGPRCTITGTDDADVLTGTAGRDVICAAGGADTVKARGGNDVVRGSSGNDTIFGGAGDDELYGQEGNDILDGGDGLDLLAGGPGEDVTRQ